MILLGVGTVGGLTDRLLVRIWVRVGVWLGLRMGFVFCLVSLFGLVGLGLVWLG